MKNATTWIPRTRLLWVVAATVVPAWTLAGLHPESAYLTLGFSQLVGLWIGLDAFRGAPLGGRVTVTLPGPIRLVRGRPGDLPFRVRLGEGTHAGNLPGRGHFRLAPLLPDAVEAQADAPWVEWPGGQDAERRVPFRVLSRHRGVHRLEGILLSVVSPLGFWEIRHQWPLAGEIRVQPDLASSLRSQARFLIRGAQGLRAHRQAGRGREFEKLRDYVPGDGIEDIHWKATAKRRHPVTRVHQVERTQEVYVLVDASRFSGRPVPVTPPDPGSRADREQRAHAPEGRILDVSPGSSTSTGEGSVPEPLLEHALRATLVLGAVVQRQCDLFGVVTFAQRVDTFLRAQRGPTHFNACRERLVRQVTHPESPDFAELATLLQTRLRKRALLLFLCDLSDATLAADFLQGARLLRRRHVVGVIQPEPPTARPLFTGTAPRTVDALHESLAGHFQWKQIRELRKILGREGIPLIPAPVHHLATALVNRYHEVKGQQQL